MAYRKSNTRTRRAATRRPTTRKVTTRRASNGGNPWCREEIAFMRKFYRNHSTAWIARQLGRTVYSVRYKASDLSIKKANPSSWMANPAAKFVAKKTRTPQKRSAKTTRRTSTRRVVRRANSSRKIGRRTAMRRK